ncbi:MAG: S-layer homology domain-containing protein [Oscillospiraceae bacterium]|nr:S-layer homology domain-containing protein [Oscillospiraceae bacterium]
MKKRLRKLTAFLLTFAMLMTLMPTFALGAGASVTAIEDVPVISDADAAEVKASIPAAPASGVPGAATAEPDSPAVLLSGESTPTTYPLWVGGEQITSEKLTVTGATGTATYAPDTNTLTLNNYTYTGAGYTDAAILYNKGSGTLNLVLEGNNAVTQTGGELSQAIFVYGNIDISGSGSLIANAGTASASYGFSCGIYVLGDFSVSGNVTLSATSGADSGIGYVNCGIFALDLTLSGGTVTAIGGTASGSMAISCGIQVNQSMTVTGGTFKAIGGTASGQDGVSYGIYASASSVTLSGGETVAQGNTAAFNNAPTIGSTFTNAGLWYGEDEASAVSGPITDLANRYTEKFVKVAENNTPPVFSIGISAVDTANGEEIAGATLQILDSAGFVVDEWVSVQDDTETTAVDESIYTTAPLNIGTTYTLHAVVAPVGYTLSSDTTFSIGMNGIPVTAGSMTLDGVLLIGFDRTEVKILAVDAVDESTTIRGATLQILDEHDTVVEEWVSYEEPHTIYALETGIPHTLRAAAAPDGYALPSEQQFAIDENSNITFSGSKAQDGTLLLGFMPIQRYSVTSAAEPAAGGSITLSVDKAARDEAFDVTVTVNDGYAVAGLYYVDGLGSETPFSEGGNSIQSPGTHTVAMPLDSPVQILVRFAPKVTFVDWDGAPLHEQYVLYGSAATAPDPAPSLEGHTFIGWDPAFDNVTAPLTVTALYRPNQYTFTFDTDGGSAVDPITQDYGTAITAPAAPTKAGYTFAGWDKELPETMPAEDLTLTAQWTRIVYSGGSYAPTTSTTVSKNEDGSTTTVTENKATGAKTEVTTRPDGSSVTVETKPDGSATTEEVRKDGTSVKTNTPAGGETTAEVKTGSKTEVTVPVPEANTVTGVVVTDKNGNKTELRDFEITASGVKFPVSGDCTVSFSRAAKKAFEDVHAVNHWAIADIDYAYGRGLMKGTSETGFSPDVPLTRAMLVTILYRLEGEPATNRSIPFADVDMGAYYGSAVSWAKQNGIVTGISETHFAPDANITREQFAVIIFRYAMAKGLNAVTMEENLHFKDADEISAYAVSAMNWAVGAELIKGKSTSTVNPKDNATRAEAAAILHRFLESGKA